MKKRIIAISIFAAILLSLFSLSAFAEDEPAHPIVTVDPYGRSALAECENSVALLYAYDALVKGVPEMSTEISVYNGTNPISKDELRTVMDAYRRDRADQFHLANTYSVSYDDNSVKTLRPDYLFTSDELPVAKAAVDAEVDKILHAMPGGITDFEKLVYLHDTLAARIEYVDTENAHNLYGALVNGKAVCEGYAEALQYLLHRVGINSFLAIGSSYVPGSDTTVGHEWNYVKLDGEWFHVDLTWNDQGENLYHAYFGLTDTEITADHIIDAADYQLPTCTSGANNYFAVKGGVFNAPYSVDAIAAVFAASPGGGSFYVDDITAFHTFLGENVNTIALLSGVLDFDYVFTSMGRELQYSYKCKHPSYVQVQDEKYIKDPGNCKQKVTYWLSCEECGASAGNDPALADKFFEGDFVHRWSEQYTSAGGEHWRGCTSEGCNAKTDRASCVGGTATCVKQAVCDICSNPYGELAEHIFETEGFSHKEKDGHAHQCTVCHTAHDGLVEHTPDREEPTDDDSVKCEDCGYIITPSLNHGDNHIASEEWSYDDTAHWHVCTGCSEDVKLNFRVHNDKDKDGACDDCAYPVPVEPTVEITDKLLELTSTLTKDQIIYIAVGSAAVIVLGFIFKIASLVHRRRRW